MLRRHLLSAAVVLLLSTLALGSASSDDVASEDDGEATPTSADLLSLETAAESARVHPGGRWKVETLKSQMDDSEGMALVLEGSGNGVFVDPRKLTLECYQGLFWVMVETDARLQREGEPPPEKWQVRFRLDDGPIERGAWSVIGTGKNILSAPEPQELARRLASAERVRIEYDTSNGPLVVNFFPHGLGTRLGEIARMCGWEYTPPAEAPADTTTPPGASAEPLPAEAPLDSAAR